MSFFILCSVQATPAGEGGVGAAAAAATQPALVRVDASSGAEQARCVLSADAEDEVLDVCVVGRGLAAVPGLRRRVLYVVDTDGMSLRGEVPLEHAVFGCCCADDGGGGVVAVVSTAHGVCEVDCATLAVTASHALPENELAHPLPGAVSAAPGSAGLVLSTEFAAYESLAQGFSMRHVAAGGYGSQLHVWRLGAGHVAAVDLVPEGVAPSALHLLDPRRRAAAAAAAAAATPAAASTADDTSSVSPPAKRLRGSSPKRLLCEGFAACCPAARIFHVQVWEEGRGEGEGGSGVCMEATKVIDIPDYTRQLRHDEALARQETPAMLTSIVGPPDGLSIFIAGFLHGEVRQYDVRVPSRPVLIARVAVPGEAGVAAGAPGPTRLLWAPACGTAAALPTLLVCTGFLEAWHRQYRHVEDDAASEVLRVSCAAGPAARPSLTLAEEAPFATVEDAVCYAVAYAAAPAAVVPASAAVAVAADTGGDSEGA